MRKVPRRRRWPWPLTLVGASAAAVAGAPLAAAVGVGLVAGGMLDSYVHVFRRNRARKILAALPFGVITQQAGGLDPWRNPRSISTATLRVTSPIDDDAAQQLAARLLATANLSITVEDDRITLAMWTWKTDDMLLLAHVLDRWGRTVHASHTIAEVSVVFGAGGPAPSI